MRFSSQHRAQGDTPCNPSSFSDHIAEKFYQKVIDNEQKNFVNTKSEYSSDIKVQSIEQVIPKLSYFNPFDARGKRVKGKHANLVFH
jgi:hypothetical protein